MKIKHSENRIIIAKVSNMEKIKCKFKLEKNHKVCRLLSHAYLPQTFIILHMDLFSYEKIYISIITVKNENAEYHTHHINLNLDCFPQSIQLSDDGKRLLIVIRNNILIYKITYNGLESLHVELILYDESKDNKIVLMSPNGKYLLVRHIDNTKEMYKQDIFRIFNDPKDITLIGSNLVYPFILPKLTNEYTIFIDNIGQLYLLVLYRFTTIPINIPNINNYELSSYIIYNKTTNHIHNIQKHLLTNYIETFSNQILKNNCTKSSFGRFIMHPTYDKNLISLIVHAAY